MMKTFKKALAITLSLVLMLGMVSVNVFAEVTQPPKIEMINEFYGDGSDARTYSTYLRANKTNSGYRSFFQFDFSGYEYLINDENTALELSLQGKNDASAKTSSFKIFALPDRADGYSTNYTTSGMTFNGLSSYLTTSIDIDNDTPFAERTDSTNTSAVLKIPGNKQIILDALNKNESLVSFQFVGASNSTQTNKNGFTHASENTYLQINNADDVDPQVYVDGLAEKFDWSFVSDQAMNNVSSALTLPQKFYGASITWESTNEDAVNPTSGEVVINPAEYTYVTLTANLSYTTYAGTNVIAEKEFNVRLPKEVYDYSTGNGSYHDGVVDFLTRGSASGGNHVGEVSIVSGIAGKEDDCYMLQDASGKTRYDLNESAGGNSYRDVIEFSICIPSDAYGYHTIIRVYTGKSATDSSSSLTELKYAHDGIYLTRGSGKKLLSWDGSKWHHVAVQVPGIVSSDASGIEYDYTLKIFVDGVCEYDIDVNTEDFPAPHGIQYVQTNGLCPDTDYTEDSTWDTVACYLDNLRWTHDAYVADYNTKSAIESNKSEYGIDNNGETITIIGEGTTVKNIVDSLTIDEEANARVYNSSWELQDETHVVENGDILVVADTNGTTSERSYAYYTIRVLADGETAFDLPYITKDGDNVTGTVKLFNNSDETKTFKVFLAVYNADKELVGIVVEPAVLSVEAGEIGSIVTNGVNFASGNTAKLFVWENDEITPALTSVSFE